MLHLICFPPFCDFSLLLFVRFQVDADDKLTQTIRDIKLKLSARNPSMPPASVKLIFKGTSHPDKRLLRDIKSLKNGSTFIVKYDKTVAEAPKEPVFCPQCKARVTCPPEEVPILVGIVDLIQEYQHLRKVFGAW